MADYEASYRGARERIQELVTTASTEDLDRTVPATPEWTVKELVAHLVGIAVDSIAGNVEGMGAPGWTDRQVSERRDSSVDDLVAEWSQAASTIEPTLNEIHPALAGGLIADAHVHEQDLRGALGEPGARDIAALELPIYTYVRFLGTRLKKNELPALRIQTEGSEWVAGAGEPELTVTAEPFEMFRSLTGRRTREQVRKLDWSGDPERFLDAFPNYPYATSELGE